MPQAFQATNTGIPAAVRRSFGIQSDDPIKLLQSIDSSLKAITGQYIQPNVMLMRQGNLQISTDPSGLDVSPLYELTDPVRLIVIQAITGTVEIVFGMDGSDSVLETFQISDTNPGWQTLPWGNKPIQLRLRNPSATVVAQFGLLLIGGNV